MATLRGSKFNYFMNHIRDVYQIQNDLSRSLNLSFLTLAVTSSCFSNLLFSYNYSVWNSGASLTWKVHTTLRWQFMIFGFQINLKRNANWTACFITLENDWQDVYVLRHFKIKWCLQNRFLLKLFCPESAPRRYQIQK